MKEIIWKDVNGFDYYKISNEGIIVNKRSNQEKKVFKHKCTDKLMVGLNKNGKTYTKSIDGLLYEHFEIDNTVNIKIDGEVWSNIQGCEGRYQVSNKGRVRSLDRYIKQMSRHGSIIDRFIKGRILSINRNNGKGYISVQLPDGAFTEKEENFYIHQLVAQTFITNPENKPTVNHKDGNKSNNTIENLEWATSKEQIDHAISNNLNLGVAVYAKGKQKRGSELSYAKINEDIAKEIYKMAIDSNLTDIQISKMYDISRKSVNNIKNKKTWKHIHND